MVAIKATNNNNTAVIKAINKNNTAVNLAVDFVGQFNN